MRLSDFFPTEQIFRDGEFSALGLSNSDGPEGMLSFLEDARFASELLDNPRIRAVICRPEDGAAVAERKQGVVLSDTPRLTYFQLHNRLAELPDYCPPQTPSVIPESCHVRPLAYIAPTGVVLGENVTVEEFVSIHGPCRVGDNTVLHAGVKLGGPGYEFKYLPEGGVLDIAHCGGVAVGADVVLFENVTVHREVYPWDETVIGDECRVNAQSHIGGKDEGTDVQRSAVGVRNPILFHLYQLVDRLDIILHGDLRNAETIRRVLHPGRIAFGTEQLDGIIGRTVSLHAFKNFLSIMEHHASGIQFKRGIRYDSRIVPALPRFIVHQEHMIRKNFAEAELGLIRRFRLRCFCQFDFDVQHNK